LIGGEGLTNVAGRTAGKGLYDVSLTRLGGNHHHRDVLDRIDGAELPDKLQAVHEGHVNVTEGEVQGVLSGNA
jgi:hypothetical protein